MCLLGQLLSQHGQCLLWHQCFRVGVTEADGPEIVPPRPQPDGGLENLDIFFCLSGLCKRQLRLLARESNQGSPELKLMWLYNRKPQKTLPGRDTWHCQWQMKWAGRPGPGLTMTRELATRSASQEHPSNRSGKNLEGRTLNRSHCSSVWENGRGMGRNSKILNVISF